MAPQRSKSSSDLLLRLGNNKHATLRRRGKTTPTSRFYFAQTQTTPGTYDIQGAVVQKGVDGFSRHQRQGPRVEAIGGQRLHLHASGQTFLRRKKTSYLVHVPAVIKKSFSNSRGREFMVPHNAFMHEALTAPSILPLERQQAALKEKLLDFMVMQLDRDADGKIILHQDSDAVAYGEGEAWTFDAQTVVETDSGEMRTKPVLDIHWVQLHSCQAQCTQSQGLLPDAMRDPNGN